MKNHVISTRVSDEVFDALNLEMKEKGYKTIATLLRSKLENEVRDERLFSEFRNDILNYKNEMARIGSNLNQIAHRLHLFIPVGADEIKPDLVTLNKMMVHLNLSLSEALVNVDTSRR
ncbi:plasmid mobilization relaxosome protein MobC [Vibrio sp. 10N.261.46.A3]|uniref:plasmid mobilization relaxosome protein MobC n=1 Tax=Vibrio sp. 10N.261.46.A3 TaxID=3229658 RepID=UPI00354DC87B